MKRICFFKIVGMLFIMQAVAFAGIPTQYVMYTPQIGATDAPTSEKNGSWDASMETTPITGSSYGFIWSEDNDSTSFAGFELNSEKFGITEDHNVLGDLVANDIAGAKREFSTNVKLVNSGVDTDQILLTDRFREEITTPIIDHRSTFTQMTTVYIKDGVVQLQHSTKHMWARYFAVNWSRWMCTENAWDTETPLPLYYSPTKDGNLSVLPGSIFKTDIFVPITIEYVKVDDNTLGFSLQVNGFDIYFTNDIDSKVYTYGSLHKSYSYDLTSHYVSLPGEIATAPAPVGKYLSPGVFRNEISELQDYYTSFGYEKTGFTDPTADQGFDWDGLTGAVEVADVYYGTSSGGQFTKKFSNIKDPKYKEEQIFPRITSILYVPPGGASSVTIAEATSYSSSSSISATASGSASVSAGVEIDPEVLSGYCGIEAEISAEISASIGKTAGLSYTQSTEKAYTVNSGGGDLILVEELTVVNTVVQRKKHPYIFIDTDVDAAYVGVLVTVPKSKPSLNAFSVTDFKEKYSDREDVLNNFASLYVKDIVTGEVDVTKGHLKSLDEITIYGGATENVLTDGLETTATSTQEFVVGVSSEISGKVTAGSVFIGGKVSLSLETSVSFEQSTTSSFLATYTLADEQAWDKIVVKQYIDTASMVRIFTPILEESFTSAPHEPFTQASAEFKLTLTEPTTDTLFVEESSTCILNVKNITKDGSPAVSSVVPKLDDISAYNEDDYDVTISPDPATIILKQGDSIDFTITYTPLYLTVVPLTLHIKYGYDSDLNIFEHIGTSAIDGMMLPIEREVAITSQRSYAKEGYSLVVAPTPIEDIAKIVFSSNQSEMAQFTLYSSSERVIAQIEKNVVAHEMNSFNWKELEVLEKGVYYIVMTINGDRKAITRTIKIDK